MLRRYYDRNTRWFLFLGGSRRIATIHRALWAPEVKNRAEALDTPHRLLARQAQAHAAKRILDLGCGVGGALFSLAQKLPHAWHGLGVTISPLQAELARRETHRRSLDAQLDFLATDFLTLPALEPFDLAFSIEAFVLCPDPAGYFSSAARALRPGGWLVLIDDFLTPLHRDLSPEETGWIETFRIAWHASGFNTTAAAERHALQAGLILREELDLSAWVRTTTWRDRLVAWSVALGRPLGMHGPYWDSLLGGDALRRCIAHGLSQYSFLVFEKVSHA
jgi:cyclopropane fatty-acyl-phospholipid synthase-like methyltransferase